MAFKKRELWSVSECTYVFNEDFENTNTSKSLLCALDTKTESDTIWMNGDIVFDYKLLDLLFNTKESCMLVNSLSVAEEEVKYTVKKDGTIKEVSKEIQNGMGEAVGINKIIKKYNSQFVEELRGWGNQDYWRKQLRN